MGDSKSRTSKTPKLKKYKFEPLRPGKIIRVLHLYPATNKDEALNGELRINDLESKEAEKYEALSWCWGNQQPTETLRVHVGGFVRSKKITPNLASALKSLRQDDHRRVLWVDDICIDQKNIQERNHQVPIMNLVYGKATSVCVWLDDNRPVGKDRHFDAEIAFKFIKEDVLDLWHFDRICEEDSHSPHWVALMQLMTKPWFSRRWVIQEIALAPRATIYCGDYSIDWKDFADAVSLFVEAESATHRLSEVVRSDKQFNNIQDLFADVHKMGATLLVEMTSNLFRLTNDGQKRKPVSTLEHLVSRLSMFDSTQVRDTIYALLAISRDADPQTDPESASLHDERLQQILRNPRLDRFSKEEKRKKVEAAKRVTTLLAGKLNHQPYQVDYSKPVLDVYKQFVEFCIEQSKSLDILCRPWAPRAPPDLHRLSKGDRTGEDEDDTENSDADFPPEMQIPTWDLPAMPSWISDKENTAYVLNNHEVTRVRMERRNADPLVGLPERRSYSASGGIPVRRKKLRFRRGPNQYDQSLFVEGFFLDEVKDTSEPALRGNIPRDWLRLTNWHPRSPNPAPANFCRTLVADKGQNGLNPPPFYERACTEVLRLLKGLEALDTNATIHERQCTIVAQFLRRVREVIFNRQLIKTKGVNAHRSGVLGIAPKTAKCGDMIAILYGCSVPVILRKQEKTKEELEAELDWDLKQHPVKLQRAVEMCQKRMMLRREVKKKQAQVREKSKDSEPSKPSGGQTAKVDHESAAEKSLPETRNETDDQVDADKPQPSPMSEQQPNGSGPNHGSASTNESSDESDPNGTNGFNESNETKDTTGSTPSDRSNAEDEDQTVKKDLPEKLGPAQQQRYDKMRAEWIELLTTNDYPFKSRPKEKEPFQDTPFGRTEKNLSDVYGSHYYKLVGECYVDDMMNGEALDVRTDEDLKDVLFELR